VNGKAKGGGSSKQFVITVVGDKIRMRVIQPREAARLMGLPDAYKLPANPLEALSLIGDGVVVPAVRHLAQQVLEPILRAAKAPATEIAQRNPKEESDDDHH
jgi:DNA (cytosine-5)-methyltransferase 1